MSKTIEKVCNSTDPLAKLFKLAILVRNLVCRATPRTRSLNRFLSRSLNHSFALHSSARSLARSSLFRSLIRPPNKRRCRLRIVAWRSALLNSLSLSLIKNGSTKVFRIIVKVVSKMCLEAIWKLLSAQTTQKLFSSKLHSTLKQCERWVIYKSDGDAFNFKSRAEIFNETSLKKHSALARSLASPIVGLVGWPGWLAVDDESAKRFMKMRFKSYH